MTEQRTESSPSKQNDKTLGALHLLVKKEATVAAFDDCFLITARIFLLALVPTLLLRVAKQ
jgi:hypothetical protein